MRRDCASLFPACAVLTFLVSAGAHAQERSARGGMFEAAVPGGLPAALAVLEDRATPDRSQFLVEVIRRFHAAPGGGRTATSRPSRLQALLAHLDAATASAGVTATGGADTVPLPLPPEIWIETVFRGRTTRESLVSAILGTRNASLLYCALLSLDDETREWLAGRRDLVGYLNSRAAAFLAAAPGLRIRQGRLQLPGGAAAEPIWKAIAEGNPDDPAGFMRKIVDVRRGRLAYFLGAMSPLSAAQVRVALNLDAADSETRVTSARRLLAVFERIAGMWDLEQQPFWRPTPDPALLLSELRFDTQGEVVLPGTQAFWTQVVPESSSNADPFDFAWLSELVFGVTRDRRDLRYGVALFAARNSERINPDNLRDAVEAVRAAGEYPALIAALERAGVADLAAYAAAARRAASLGAIRDGRRARLAIVQFQGVLALMVRAARRSGPNADSLPALVSSLSAVETDQQGDYDGRLLRWFVNWLSSAEVRGRSPGAGSDGPVPTAEAALLRILSGGSGVAPGDVEWEGTRYRVDLSASEAVRLERLLGETPRPFISVARALLDLSEPLEAPAAIGRLRALLDEVQATEATLAGELPEEDARAFESIARDVRRAASAGNVGRAVQRAADLRRLADEFFARGLLEFTYAVALGQPGTAAISPGEAAARHDLGLAEESRREWQLPQPALLSDRGWYVTGSLLGLDVRLARFSLTRTSSRPPPRKPSLNEVDRRVFTEAVTLIEPAVLTETQRDAIALALRNGRARLAEARSADDIDVLAEELRLSPVRRTLLKWAAAHEPERVAASLSLSELLSLGTDAASPPGLFDGWGAPAGPRTGCLCLRVDRDPWDPLKSRWNTGMFASAFPDLNLRLAELLAELGMPARLLGSVLASATVDLVENADSRDPDDRRALVEFVHSVGRERVEEYLALLTTGGPLVPADSADQASARSRQ